MVCRTEDWDRTMWQKSYRESVVPQARRLEGLWAPSRWFTALRTRTEMAVLPSGACDQG